MKVCYWCHGNHLPSDCTLALSVVQACAYLGPIRCWPASEKHAKERMHWWLDGKLVGHNSVLRAAADKQRHR